MKHESFCHSCGTPIEHELQFEKPASPIMQPKLVPAYSPCPTCFVLIKTTGLPFFEQVEPESAPVAVFSQYKQFREMVAAKKLAEARAAGPKIVL